MNIAYASADFGIEVFGSKGASVHIQEMIKAFLDWGHHIDIVTPQNGGVPVGLNVGVHRVLTAPPPVTESDFELAKNSDRIFKERRNLAVADSVERELLRQHAAKPFSFIYERYSLWSAAGVRAASKLGVPLVLEVNAPLLLEQQKYRKLVLAGAAEAVERECFENADLIFAVSAEVRDYLISNGAAANKVFVQPNGVDLDRFDPVGYITDAVNTHLPVIGFSGGLRPWHGIEDLVRAFHKLNQSGLASHLLIVGDGPLRGWVEGYTEAACLRDRITLAGWAPHDRIPDYIRRMDVATAPYPAIEDFYFSPLKLFEYMACGRAIVASNLGQIGQVIRHGENGMLCTPGKSDELAATIETVLTNKKIKQKLATAARQSSIGRSWRDCADRVTAAVHDLQAGQLKRLAS